jgi:flagellum-specific peptidoglycan hydrolase FlgJ
MPLTAIQKARLDAAVQQAVTVENRSGFPAEITVAQWAIESGWGKSQPGNNCFGHKAPAKLTDPSQRQLLVTKEYFSSAQLAAFLKLGDGRTAVKDEVVPVNGKNRYSVQDWFRKYGSLSEAFEVHVQKLQKGRYSPAWNEFKTSRDLKQLARGIHQAGYATAPNYADQLITLFSMKDIRDAIKSARKNATKMAAKKVALKVALKVAAKVAVKAAVKTAGG